MISDKFSKLCFEIRPLVVELVELGQKEAQLKAAVAHLSKPEVSTSFRHRAKEAGAEVIAAGIEDVKQQHKAEIVSTDAEVEAAHKERVSAVKELLAARNEAARHDTKLFEFRAAQAAPQAHVKGT
jgi:hypothetical protein